MQQLGSDSFAELFRDTVQEKILFESCQLQISEACLYVITPDGLSVEASMGSG